MQRELHSNVWAQSIFRDFKPRDHQQKRSTKLRHGFARAQGAIRGSGWPCLEPTTERGPLVKPAHCGVRATEHQTNESSKLQNPLSKSSGTLDGLDPDMCTGPAQEDRSPRGPSTVAEEPMYCTHNIVST